MDDMRMAAATVAASGKMPAKSDEEGAWTTCKGGRRQFGGMVRVVGNGGPAA